MTEMALQGRYREGDKSQFEKDIRLQGGALKTDEAWKQLSANDPTTVMSKFTAQWNSMLQALGAPLVEPAIQVLKSLTGAFTWVSQFANSHPDAIRRIAEALGVLAVALIGFGVGAIATAIVTIGTVPAVITAVVAALGALVAINWDKIKALFTGIGDAIEGLWNRLKGLFGGSGQPGWGSFDPTNYQGGARYTPASFTTGGTTYGGAPAGALRSGAPLVSGTAAASGPLTGNAARLMRDLVGKGWSPEAAAVMAGNVQMESGFNPSNNTGDGGTSWGLAQWHAERRNRLIAEARKAGVPWNNWDLQIALMDREWRERYGNAVGSHDFGMLSRLGRAYEGYSTNTFGARVGAAQRYLHQYLNGHQDTGAVPPPKTNGAEVTTIINLDGRTIAKSTAKHLHRMGNGPALGGRLPDYSGTRPLSV